MLLLIFVLFTQKKGRRNQRPFFIKYSGITQSIHSLPVATPVVQAFRP